MASQDKFEPEKRSEDSMRIPDISSDWRFCSTNLRNTSMGLIPRENPMAVCKGNIMQSSSCSPTSMIESYCPDIWDQPTSSQNLGFCDINVQNNTSSSSTLGFRKASLCPPRTGMDGTLDMGWTPPNSMLNGNTILQTSSRMLSQSLSQFPTDSGFIERAARFSSFSGENFGHMVNPISIPESMSPYSRGAAPMQGPQDVFSGIRLKSISGGQSMENEVNMIEGSKDISKSIEHGVSGGSPIYNERKVESFVRSHDETKQGFRDSSNSDEAEFISGGGQAVPSVLEGKCGRITAKGHGSKKQKRIGQDTELDQVRGASNPTEATKDNSEIEQKRDHNPTSTTNRPIGKHGSQASDSLKEEYIHVRARRGQATNSHSLAERVRREKISERMKFLQDLVPGCNKVTGKAVMLDEIINYVQSLQRQVEFLSMKLATVNPRLDFNIEGLLAKDILQSRPGPSSALGFHSDMSMPYHPLHPSQPGLIQAGLPSLGTSPDTLRRTITSHLTAMNGGYKESASQVPNVWEDDLNNIVRMGLSSSDTPLDSQGLDGITCKFAHIGLSSATSINPLRELTKESLPNLQGLCRQAL